MKCLKTRTGQEITTLIVLFLIAFVFLKWGKLEYKINEILLMFMIYWGSTVVTKLTSVKIIKTDSHIKRLGVSVCVCATLIGVGYGINFWMPDIGQEYCDEFILPIIISILHEALKLFFTKQSEGLKEEDLW